jgi:hypothetical protein
VKVKLDRALSIRGSATFSQPWRNPRITSLLRLRADKLGPTSFT